MPDAVFHSRDARSATLKVKATWIAVGILGGATIVGAAWRVLSPSTVPQVALASRDASGVPSLAAPVSQQSDQVHTANTPLTDSATRPPGQPSGAQVAGAGENTTPVPAANTPSPHKPVEIVQQPGPARGVGEKINLNAATADQIALLPGIGPKLAAAIVADRTKNGKYKRVADLDRVKGIGRKKIDAIRSSVTAE